MATYIIQPSAKNLLEIPDPVECSKSSITARSICNLNSTKVSYSGKSVFDFRIRAISPFKNKSYSSKREPLQVSCALNTGANSDRSDGTFNDEIPRTSRLGSTRLGRIVRASASQLLEKINGARSNFPMKTFLLLLGYYTANALATIIGQTGDWDVLVAGIAVAAIEGIGIVMYRNPIPIAKLQSLVVMVNFWKAGVCLGLFVDAFKLGS